METPDPPNGDGDEAMRMAAVGYFNDEFEPRYEVRVEGPDGSAQAWEVA